MIDVRFMAPIVRKDDSSNHSHDHTHDHYHRRSGVSDNSSDHYLPQVRAFLHTHDRSHVLVWLPLGRKDVACLSLSGRGGLTRQIRVRSTMPPGFGQIEGIDHSVEIRQPAT